MVDLRLDAQWIDYAIIALYFAFVLGVGWYAKRGVSTSIEFFLSGRSLPAWVTGLAFISANLGAVEIMGMSATGAELGMPTMHYFWVGAGPALVRRALCLPLDRALALRPLLARVGHGPRLPPRHPGLRRDHGHVRDRCGARHAHDALLLGGRRPGDALPRRGDDEFRRDGAHPE